jgi:competence protein ComGC
MRYFVLGTDGREYGPATVDELRGWIAQGRMDGKTRVRPEHDARWTLAGEQPELRPLLSALPVPGAPRPVDQTLAVVSFVLGLGALVLGPLTGIPAIVCGAVGRARARRAPAEYGGSGYATAGLVLGCVGIFLCILMLPAMLLPALARAKQKAQSISCVNQMKQVGLAFHIWAADHNDAFPNTVSTNAGGSLELAQPRADGYDAAAFAHFRVLSNELSTAKILVCPSDKEHTAAATFADLGSENVSYLVKASSERLGPTNVLCVCPVHGHLLLQDGSVHQGPRQPGGRMRFSP